jgi:hypothetical protein
MKYFVMLFQYKRVTYYWAGHGNLTGRSLMTGLRIGIFFVKDNKTVTLVPLTPKQMYEDQTKLKRENELKKNCEAESSKKDDEKDSEINKES